MLGHFDAKFDSTPRAPFFPRYSVLGKGKCPCGTFKGWWRRRYFIRTFEGNQQACGVWWDDSERKANLNWVSNFGNANDWFAFRNSLHFSAPTLVGAEFCLVSFPFHPPRSFPMSASSVARAMYCLSSKDFVSHKICRSTCVASVFRNASRTHGRFSAGGKNAAVAVASMFSMKSLSIRFPSEYFCVLGNSS